MTGRQRRLQYEYQAILKMVSTRSDLALTVLQQDALGIPTAYQIDYHIRSIAGIQEDGSPVFANQFTMQLHLPEGYPQVDAPPQFQFVGSVKPFHPNIRYYGEMAGRVCINQLNTFTDLAWGIERVALYLRYELYHAIQEPPYPEDLKVAAWVRQIGEPKEYIFFDQPLHPQDVS